MEMDEYLKILILRTLGLSQDDVAGLLHCAKQTVVNADKWFANCPQGEAFALVDDQGIRRLVGRDFPDMELSPNQLIKAGQVTGDDILLHYSRVRPHEDRSAEEIPSLVEVEPVARVDPVYVKLLERHWGRLREQAIAFRTQLLPPDIETLFGAEVCRKVYHAIQSGASLLSTSSWTKVVDAPLELKLLIGTAQERMAEVRLSVEQEFLFPHLLSHMQAEFAEFAQFEVWKTQLGRLVQMCLERAENVTRSCSGAAGMYYSGGGRQKWLSFYFPAYVCQFVFNHTYSETMPKLYTELQPDGLWKLMPEECPAITLALDSADHIHRCQEVLIKEVRDNTRLEVWREIGKELADLQTKADQLQIMLTTAIEKVNFKGACSLCEGCFAPSQSA